MKLSTIRIIYIALGAFLFAHWCIYSLAGFEDFYQFARIEGICIAGVILFGCVGTILERYFS